MTDEDKPLICDYMIYNIDPTYADQLEKVELQLRMSAKMVLPTGELDKLDDSDFEKHLVALQDELVNRLKSLIREYEDCQR